MQPAEIVVIDQPRRRRRVGVLVAAAVAVVLAGAGVIGYVLLRPDTQPVSNTEQVRANCRTAVLERLRAPATARFVGTEKVTDNGYRYFIEGEVDSENGFGALLRSKYTCITIKNGIAVDEVDIDTR